MRKSATWDQDDKRALEAQGHAEYNYRRAVAPSSARELRLFGRGEWLVDRFAENRRRMVGLRWRASRLRRGSLATTITVLAAANGLFLWPLAQDASRGALAPGAAIAFAQAAVGTVALAFVGLNWAVPPAARSVAVVGLTGAGKATLVKLPTRVPTASQRLWQSAGSRPALTVPATRATLHRPPRPRS